MKTPAHTQHTPHRRLPTWLTIALLLLAATILGSTVLREPIAQAAQLVDAKIIGPLDGDGNVKVHEQGTAAVREQNLDQAGRIRVHEEGQPTVKAQQEGPWNVNVSGSPDVTVDATEQDPVPVRDVDNPGAHPFQRELPGSPDNLGAKASFQLGGARRIAIEYASMRCVFASGSATATAFEVDTHANGASAGHFVPVTTRQGTAVAGQMVKIYADPDSPISLISRFAWDGEPGFAGCTFSVSGHLFDVESRR
jgi:hypothetical protein